MKNILSALFILFAFSACFYYDGPPKTDHLGPEPSPHNGIFVSGADTLFFNGDGKTIRWSFSTPIDSMTATGQGSYVFKFHHGKFRYDASERFGIYDGRKSHDFMTGPSMNSEDSISLYIVDGSKKKKEAERRIFKKIESK